MKKLDRLLSTRSQDYIDFFNEHPEAFSDKFSVRTFASILRGFDYLENKHMKISVPVVVIQGTEDKLVDIPLNKLFAENCIGPDKSYWSYEGVYHDLFHEPEVFEITERIIEWANSRLPKIKEENI